MTIDIAQPATWPVLLTVIQVAAILGLDFSTVYDLLRLVDRLLGIEDRKPGLVREHEQLFVDH